MDEPPKRKAGRPKGSKDTHPRKPARTPAQVDADYMRKHNRLPATRHAVSGVLLKDLETTIDPLVFPDENLRAQLFIFLQNLVKTNYRAAMEKADITYLEIFAARRKHPPLAQLLDDIRAAKAHARVQQIEDALAELAAPTSPERTPDSRAAQIFLQGNDERYKPNPTPTAQAVQINIQL